MISIGLEAISETIILDEYGNSVDWNTYCENNTDESRERQIYKKY